LNLNKFFKGLIRLDGKHVVFGQVVEGLKVLNEIEFCGTNSGRPKKKILIRDCGEIKKEVF